MILRHSAMLSWTLWLTVTSIFWRLTGQQLVSTSAFSSITSVLSKRELLLKSLTSPSTIRSEPTCKMCKNFPSLRSPTTINWRSTWKTWWVAWTTTSHILSDRSSRKSMSNTIKRSSPRWLTSSPCVKGGNLRRRWRWSSIPRWGWRLRRQTPNRVLRRWKRKLAM